MQLDGSRIRAMREFRGLTQGQLAYKADTTVTQISRLENEWEPIFSGSVDVRTVAMPLTSSYQGDNFQAVAFAQPVFGMLLTRNQLKIGLHGHVLAGQAQVFQQLRDRRARADCAGLAVDGDLHPFDPLR